MPYLFAAPASAPASMSRLASVTSSFRTAQCSAVVPSGSVALTSMRASSRATAWVVFPALTALTSRVSPAAVAAPAARTTAHRLKSVDLIAFSAALQVRERPGAVAELLQVHAGLVEHRHEQVRHRCVIRVLQVPPALHPAGRPAHDQVRQREVVVRVAVAHVAAVEQHAVVEQRAVAVGGVPHLLDELGEHADVERLDADVLLHLLRA